MEYIEYDKTKSKKSYTPKEVTPEKALLKLMKMCSLGEKCEKDSVELLKRWKVDADKHDEIIAYLIENKYIDNIRFAFAYTRDKSNFSAWGETKIKMALRAKGISNNIIEDAISSIDENSMIEKTEKALDTKLRNLKYKDNYDLRNKLLRFAFSRGYDMGVVSSYIEKKVKNLY